MNKSTLLFCLVAFAGCSDESDGNMLSGYYKVVSIESTRAVDLNNDGVPTKDIYFEIAGPHHAPDGTVIPFFDFNQHSSYVEVRPLDGNAPEVKHIDFRFPHQHIDEMSDGRKFLHAYLQTFYAYTYELPDANNIIALRYHGNPDYEQPGELRSLKLLTNGKLELKLRMDVFDFSAARWKSVELTTLYAKVE